MATAGQADDLAGRVADSGVRFHAVAGGSPRGWLAILDRLEKLKPARVYPGHGPVGGPEVIAADRAYTHAFMAATAAPATRVQAMATLKAAYPDHLLPVIADYRRSPKVIFRQVCGQAFRNSVGDTSRASPELPRPKALPARQKPARSDLSP